MENRSNSNNPNIKLYVVCHKPSYVPENPYLYPVQVGTDIAGESLANMLHDNEGENISNRNKTYCELTAQYWAWKNEDADYYGFFHYRRYMSFDPKLERDDGWGNIAYERITEEAIQELKLNPKAMKEIITKYDVISVKGRRYPRIKEAGMPLDVYHEYGMAEFQHREDLDITLNILEKKYPEFKEIADEYMKSSVAHECNMFIMKKEIFYQYCEWLFDILFEAEKQIDMEWYSVEEFRVMGYLAERLCGIYYTYLKKQTFIKAFELPKTLFHDTSPKVKLTPVLVDGIPVVLSANDKFAPYLDVMIQSIIANSSAVRKYDIIVLYNDISEKNKNLITKAAKKRTNISIRFVLVSEYFDSEKLFVNQHLSVETYYRLIIPEIMPGYHKILYLDCDMVVNHDIAELYDMNLSGCIIGATKDIDVAGQVKLGQNNWGTYATEHLGLDRPYDYFQAGVLVINLDELRRTVTSEEMINLALSKAWRCHDQDVLNMVCKNNVTYIPQQWDVLMNWEEAVGNRMQIMKMAPKALYEEYLGARKQPYIIHFAGYQKPWDVVDCDMSEYFWEYAKMSPFYPRLLQAYNQCNSDTKYRFENSLKNNGLIRRIANRVLPYGSRRREFIKRTYRIFHG